MTLILSSCSDPLGFTGSAYPAVNAGVFEKAKVPLPDEEVLKKFDALTARTIHQSDILKVKNENLKKQRGALVPKLITGSINLQGYINELSEEK